MKKIIAFIMAMLMIVGTMAFTTSCGYSGYDMSSETLVMATNAEFPPYEYKDGNEFKGIDIEIAQEIAKRMGKKLEIKDVKFDAALLGISEGKYDVVLAGLTAEGYTTIEDIYHIDRGYENMEGHLLQLGADIKRIII